MQMVSLGWHAKPILEQPYWVQLTQPSDQILQPAIAGLKGGIGGSDCGGGSSAEGAAAAFIVTKSVVIRSRLLIC